MLRMALKYYWLLTVSWLNLVITTSSLAPPPDIAAFPDSVNCLGGSLKDVRTPDKLIDGYHDTTEGAHMWLAPVLPDIVSPTP